MERSRGPRHAPCTQHRLSTVLLKKKAKLQRHIGDLNVERALAAPSSTPIQSLVASKEQLLGHMEAVYRREHGGALIDALVKRRRVA